VSFRWKGGNRKTHHRHHCDILGSPRSTQTQCEQQGITTYQTPSSLDRTPSSLHRGEGDPLTFVSIARFFLVIPADNGSNVFPVHRSLPFHTVIVCYLGFPGQHSNLNGDYAVWVLFLTTFMACFLYYPPLPLVPSYPSLSPGYPLALPSFNFVNGASFQTKPIPRTPPSPPNPASILVKMFI
jgi:hypothetical protein